MITKEQAATATSFKQIYTHAPKSGYYKDKPIEAPLYNDGYNKGYAIDKPVNWRANGKLKTWKRDTTRFSLPIKHGLYSYGYLTNDNAHLFEVV